MSSPEASPEPAAARPPSLRRLALESIGHGLRTGRELPIELARQPEAWRAHRASFVTLRIEGQLRGCTGHLEAVLPLVSSVARNAFRSAFADPRFPPLEARELGALDVKVSVRSPASPRPVDSEDELLRRLRPGVDGLILHEGRRTATFLPAVWETLPEPTGFLRALREKAGLRPDHWSSAIRFERYTTTDAE